MSAESKHLILLHKYDRGPLLFILPNIMITRSRILQKERPATSIQILFWPPGHELKRSPVVLGKSVHSDAEGIPLHRHERTPSYGPFPTCSLALLCSTRNPQGPLTKTWKKATGQIVLHRTKVNSQCCYYSYLKIPTFKDSAQDKWFHT